jgi:hypothetical protein
MHSAKGAALIFLALAAGYMVCVNASKEKGFLKNLGYVIATIILLGSFLFITAKVGMMGHCKMLKYGMKPPYHEAGESVHPVK